MKQFSQAVIEGIEYYVYILKNPISSKVFYVGKGTGNRIFKHVENALIDPTVSDKSDLIREINERGNEVEHYILRHGLTQDQALEIESACIDLLGLENLTNAVKGHNTFDRGLKTTDEIAQYYDAKIITISEPTIIININKLYKRFISSQELYDVTRSAWQVDSLRAKKCEYAIAAYRGIVREVYKIYSWNINTYGDRWEFVGEVAKPEIREKYINQSLGNYVKKGSQNPIKYTF